MRRHLLAVQVTLWAYGIIVVGALEDKPAHASGRQFPFGGGGINGFPNFFGNFQNARGRPNQFQSQQQFNPVAQATTVRQGPFGNNGFRDNAPGGVLHLGFELFNKDETDAQVLETLGSKLPGINSGFITSNPGPQKGTVNKATIEADEPDNSHLPACSPRNESFSHLMGFCANAFDVVIKRRCIGMRTDKSAKCADTDTCCFRVGAQEVLDPAVAFDQVPCGMRRTPELAQQELPRVLDEKGIQMPDLAILKGLEAFQTEICWQAAIKLDGVYKCSGTVLNSRHVITAANCLNDVESLHRIQVITGVRDLKNEGKCADKFSASKVIFQDNYDPRLLRNDIAIIQLSQPITRSDCACKLCLPDQNSADIETKGQLDCIVTGFGTTKAGLEISDVGPLNIANVSIIPEQPGNRKCSERLHLSPKIPKRFNPDSTMICAIGDQPSIASDTCDFDGGSPLACRMNSAVRDIFSLVGISSWGLPCGENVKKDAAGKEVRIPTVYAYTRPVLDWIAKHIQTQQVPK